MLSDKRQKSDIHWCVNSPGLILPETSVITWPTDAWFADMTIDKQIKNYPQPRHPHHFRLGHHFEALLICWLSHARNLTLLHANQQVFDRSSQKGVRTVGEFDFLVICEEQVEHWEVAVKFYLGLGDTSQLRHWHGPNTHDRLDLKYHHLIEHQLLLSTSEHGKQTLQALGLKINKIRALVKGRLFYPWNDFIRIKFIAPREINPSHEKGWWIDEQDLTPEHFHRCVYLAKQYWLSPIHTNDELDVMDLAQLRARLALPDTEQTTHIALLDTDGNELSRGFIVKPIWRERANQNQA